MKTRRSLALILLLGLSATGCASTLPYQVDAEGPYLTQTLSPQCVAVLAGPEPPEPSRPYTREEMPFPFTEAEAKFFKKVDPDLSAKKTAWEACRAMADHIRRVPRVHLPAGYQPAAAAQGPVGMRCVEFPRGFTTCAFQ